MGDQGSGKPSADEMDEYGAIAAELLTDLDDPAWARLAAADPDRTETIALQRRRRRHLYSVQVNTIQLFAGNFVLWLDAPPAIMLTSPAGMVAR